MLENLSSPPLKYIFAIEFSAMQIDIDFHVYNMLYLLYIEKEVANASGASQEQQNRFP
jgi:hypothetical protein